jgi:hypothetical protein
MTKRGAVDTSNRTVTVLRGQMLLAGTVLMYANVEHVSKAVFWLLLAQERRDGLFYFYLAFN